MVQNHTTKITNAVINPAVVDAPIESKPSNVASEETCPILEKNEDDLQGAKTMFNFDQLFSRKNDEDDTLPIEILQDRVNAIKIALKSCYERAMLSFHQRNQGTLYIKLTIGSRFYRTLWSAADQELCFAVMCAIRGKFDLIDSYSADGRHPEKSDKNLVLEILKDFLKSRLRAKIGSDFVTEDGKHFKNFSLHLSKTCLVKFCVEDSEELKTFLQTA